jgi:hypothetical protein
VLALDVDALDVRGGLLGYVLAVGLDLLQRHMRRFL